MNRLRVLFVCLGNSCRSQMAEAFAKAYGPDVLAAESAGLAPASIIVDQTILAMDEKNISLDEHHPKPLDEFQPGQFDLVVNMTTYALPGGFAALEERWPVPDPIMMPMKKFKAVRDDIERRVMQLILRQRQAADPPSAR